MVGKFTDVNEASFVFDQIRSTLWISRIELGLYDYVIAFINGKSAWVWWTTYSQTRVWEESSL